MDVNGDNLPDIIGGGADGVYVYQKRLDGTYEAPYILLDTSYYDVVTWVVSDPFRNPRDMGITEAIKPFIIDWNRDGTLDLLFGDLKGHVYFYPGTGQDHGILQFGSPERLIVNDEVLLAFHGNAAPHVVDWDSDGNHDLLLGSTTGGVQFYRNTAAAGMPELVPPIELLSGSDKFEINLSNYDPDNEFGGQSAVCAYDWNNDGLLDLVVGTHQVKEGAERDLTLVQQAELDEAWEIYEGFRGAFLQRLHQLDRRALRELDMTSKQLRDADFDTFVRWNKRVLELYRQDRRMQRALKDGRNAYQATKKYEAIDTWYGEIRVYLQKPHG